MTDTGPLFVSSGDLIADRRYKWALDHVGAGRSVGRRRHFGADRRAGAALRHGLVRARRHPRPARRPRRRDRRFRASARRRPRGLSRRAAAIGAARRRRNHPGHDRNLCPPAVRPICRALRRGAHRAPALSRPDAVARRGRSRDARGRSPDAFRLDARPRLRHRPWRRRVPAVRRLAGRCRSLARHDRASRDQGSCTIGS